MKTTNEQDIELVIVNMQRQIDKLHAINKKVNWENYIKVQDLTSKFLGRLYLICMLWLASTLFLLITLA